MNAQFRIHYHRVGRKGESVKEMDDDFFSFVAVLWEIGHRRRLRFVT